VARTGDNHGTRLVLVFAAAAIGVLALETFAFVFLGFGCELSGIEPGVPAWYCDLHRSVFGLLLPEWWYVPPLTIGTLVTVYEYGSRTGQ
jgi:hypothetical protein